MSQKKSRRKREVSDKALRQGAVEDKGLAREQSKLEAGAEFGEPPETTGKEGSTRCYNRACADYGRDRPIGEPCACKKTTARPVQGRGMGWY